MKKINKNYYLKKSAILFMLILGTSFIILPKSIGNDKNSSLIESYSGYIDKKTGRFIFKPISKDVLLAFSSLYIPPSKSPFNGGLALIWLKNQDEIAQMRALNLGIIEAYENYVLVELPKGLEDALLKSKLDVKIIPDGNKIGIGEYNFDPKGPTPVFPKGLTVKDFGPGEKGYYLIQFIGPIKEEWLAEIEYRGAELLTPIPRFAYLIRIESELSSELAQLRFVRSVSIYQPAFKIDSHLSSLVSKRLIKGKDEFNILIVNSAGKTEEIIEQIKSLGGVLKKRYTFSFYEHVRFFIDSSKISDIANIKDVYAIEKYYQPEKEDEVSDQISVGNYDSSNIPFTGFNSWLSTKGLDGTGVTVGVVDDGVDATDTIHLNSRVVDTAALRRGAPSGSNGHGHHVAGIIAGDCNHSNGNGFFYALGMAPNANLLNQPLLYDSRGNPCASGQPKNDYMGSYQDICRDTVSTAGFNGEKGYIQNNSWGAGKANPMTYTSIEREYDTYVRDSDETQAGNQSLVICFSAGNEGSDGLTRPKGAKNIITAGASENYRLGLSGGTTCGTIDANNINQIPCFSSIGNTIDGRIKPEITAPGTWIASARKGPCSLWGDIDSNHRWSSGTSQAVPHVSGAVALITQWWKNNNRGNKPSPAMVKALLINGAVDMSGSSAPPAIPNMQEGWGRINLSNIIDTGVPTIYRDQNIILNDPSEIVTFDIAVTDTSKPVKATLVWTDAPASVNANPALVNDLDLKLIQGSTIYRGNNFSGGWSVSGGTADSINNVENIYIQKPSGSYTVTVSASNLMGDGVPGNTDSTDQDFALVIYNATILGTKTEITSNISISGTATWNPPLLSGNVTLTNIDPVRTLYNVDARISLITSESNIYVNNEDGNIDGLPYWYYGTIPNNNGNATRLWEFFDPANKPFTFYGFIYGNLFP